MGLCVSGRVPDGKRREARFGRPWNVGLKSVNMTLFASSLLP